MTKSKKTGKFRWGQALFFLVLAAMVLWMVDMWRARSVHKIVPLNALQTLNKQSVNISQLSHREPVLVYFWATWCGPCRLVSPAINDLSEEYSVISVALSSGSGKEVKNYLREKKYGFTVINDPENTIARQWGVFVTPSVLVVKNGRLVSYTSGPSTKWGIWLRLKMAQWWG